jgi:hypothetical protein
VTFGGAGDVAGMARFDPKPTPGPAMLGSLYYLVSISEDEAMIQNNMFSLTIVFTS